MDRRVAGPREERHAPPVVDRPADRRGPRGARGGHRPVQRVERLPPGPRGGPARRGAPRPGRHHPRGARPRARLGPAGRRRPRLAGRDRRLDRRGTGLVADRDGPGRDAVGELAPRAGRCPLPEAGGRRRRRGHRRGALEHRCGGPFGARARTGRGPGGRHRPGRGHDGRADLRCRHHGPGPDPRHPARLGRRGRRRPARRLARGPVSEPGDARTRPRADRRAVPAGGDGHGLARGRRRGPRPGRAGPPAQRRRRAPARLGGRGRASTAHRALGGPAGRGRR